MGTILHLAAKDLRLLLRDKFGLFWILAFPLLYAGFFGMIFKSGGDGTSRGRIPVQLVDEDQSPRSARLVERLAAHESLRVERDAPEPGSPLPAAAGEGEDEAQGAVQLVPLEEARELVRLGKRTAYLRIPAGYGARPFAMYEGDGGLRLELGLDPSRSAEAGFLQGILMETSFQGMQDVLTDRETLLEQVDLGQDGILEAEDISPSQRLVLGTFLDALRIFVAQADLKALQDSAGGSGGGMGEMVDVVKVERDSTKRPRTAFEITLPQSMVWGLMGVALGFAITLVRERTRGTLLRLRVAPVRRTELLAGKALACFSMCVGAMVVLLAFGAAFLGVRVTNPVHLIVAIAATGACFTGVMMIAAVMGKTEEAVAGAAWGTMMPFAMIGGGMIPLVAMPEWLVKASNFSPFKWAIYSLEGAIWRGFSIGDMLFPCVVLVAIGIVTFAIGNAIYRRMEG